MFAQLMKAFAIHVSMWHAISVVVWNQHVMFITQCVAFAISEGRVKKTFCEKGILSDAVKLLWILKCFCLTISITATSCSSECHKKYRLTKTAIFFFHCPYPNLWQNEKIFMRHCYKSETSLHSISDVLEKPWSNLTNESGSFVFFSIMTGWQLQQNERFAIVVAQTASAGLESWEVLLNGGL